MTAPRHVSTCVTEWLDGCPFNLPDALAAIREELDMHAPTINSANADTQAKVNAAREAVEGREVQDMGAVLASHANESTEESA